MRGDDPLTAVAVFPLRGEAEGDVMESSTNMTGGRAAQAQWNDPQSVREIAHRQLPCPCKGAKITSVPPEIFLSHIILCDTQICGAEKRGCVIRKGLKKRRVLSPPQGRS